MRNANCSTQIVSEKLKNVENETKRNNNKKTCMTRYMARNTEKLEQ